MYMLEILLSFVDRQYDVSFIDEVYHMPVISDPFMNVNIIN